MAFSHLSRCMAILLATVTLSAHVELAAASGPNYYNAARALLGRPVCGGVRQECCAGDVCGAPGLTCRVKRCRPCGGKLEPACEFPGTFPCDAGFTPVQGACFTDTDGAGRGPRNGGAPPSRTSSLPPPSLCRHRSAPYAQVSIDDDLDTAATARGIMNVLLMNCGQCVRGAASALLSWRWELRVWIDGAVLGVCCGDARTPAMWTLFVLACSCDSEDTPQSV